MPLCVSRKSNDRIAGHTLTPLRAGLGMFLFGSYVGCNSAAPCRLKRATKNLLRSLSEHDMRHSHSTPSSGYGNKDFGQFLAKCSLIFTRQCEISETFGFRRQRRKDSAAHAEVCRPHMRPFCSAFETQGNASEVRRSHASFFGKGHFRRCGGYWTPGEVGFAGDARLFEKKGSRFLSNLSTALLAASPSYSS